MKIKYGEWVYGEYDIPHCSECGYEPPMNEITPICPTCNAIMENEFIDILRAAIEMVLQIYNSSNIDVICDSSTDYIHIAYGDIHKSYIIFDYIADGERDAGLDEIRELCDEYKVEFVVTEIYETEGSSMDKLAAAIEMALNKYSSDYVDVVYNEMSGHLDVMYCSHNNSFPIFENVADVDAVDKHIVAKMCDEYYVGLVW